MDGNDVDDDDAHLYDDDYHCYYNDENYCFRYQIMRNCWQEEPGDRPSFEQLRHELKRMENQHKVIYRNVILSVEYLSYNVFKNLVFLLPHLLFCHLSFTETHQYEGLRHKAL